MATEQRQDSLAAQMQAVEQAAVEIGCYDAVDWIRSCWQNPHNVPVDPHRQRLLDGLAELELHDNTGDPRDEGYMAALADVRALLSDESEAR